VIVVAPWRERDLSSRLSRNQRDAAGFIRLNALRLRTLGQRKRKLKL
jgi:hypothetical protein